MAVETRPSTLTVVHNYNLRNQGWPESFPLVETADGDPVARFFNDTGTYPSNADIVYLGKTTAADNPNNIGRFASEALRTNVFGNTPAPRGRFIINAFDRNRQTVSGINGIYDPERDKEDDRPVSTEFYAGRIWYLMPSGELYFSQTLTEVSKAGKCYQEADPTAEDINDLVATDGGVIDIRGVGQGLKLQATRRELVVIADNGIWTVSGGPDTPFSATQQEVTYITDVGATGSQAVVDVEGTVFYWSKGGIYALTPDPSTGFLVAQNLSLNTIQTRYLAIPPAAKKNAKSFYDKESKRVFWYYNDSQDYDGESFRYRFNRALVFDVALQAFYTYTFDVTGPFFTGAIQKKAGNFSSTVVEVEDGGVQVTDGGEDVTSTITTTSVGEVKLKFLTFEEVDTDEWFYTFSELEDNTMLDWTIATDGTSYDSYLETGHDIVGDLISEKEANTVYTFFKRTEMNITQNDLNGLQYDFPSSCLMRAKWHWSDSSSSNRWSQQEQVYKLHQQWIPAGTGEFDYGFEVIENISNVRGKGRALSLRFDSESGKDFHLLGWAIPYTAMTGP